MSGLNNIKSPSKTTYRKVRCYCSLNSSFRAIVVLVAMDMVVLVAMDMLVLVYMAVVGPGCYGHGSTGFYGY
jgi:hypothetical protein